MLEEGVRHDDSAGGRARRSVRSILAWLRGVPPEPILVGLGLFLLLAAFVAADPASGVSFSSGPYGDEAGNVVNARNFVQLGRWSTDDWNLYLVNVPFSVLEALAFKLFGVGLVQARLAMVLCVSLAATALAWGLRGAVGRAYATFAGVAFAASGLVLFYGRLAFLEDLVVLGLTLGVMVLARASRLSLRGGVLAGLCFAVAIGAKPSALFSVVGILLAMGIWGWRDPGVRRWIAASTAVIAAAGLFWALVIWLPNRAAVAIDVEIWPPYQWNLTPLALLKSVRAYLVGGNDQLYGMLLGPLLALAAAGSVAIAALRRHLGKDEARLAVAAFGWAAFGFGILMVVSYRPNRYVVPLVPALAILACIGLHVTVEWLRRRIGTAAEASSPAGRPTRDPRRSARLVMPLVMAAALAFSAAPGLAWYASWARHATYQLVDIQNQTAASAPAGEMVAGSHTGLFMLTSKSVLVLTGMANAGDMYAKGARWYLAPVDAGPPVGVPATSWAARQSSGCVTWRGVTECLYHVP